MKKKKFHMSKLIVPFVILSLFSFTGLAIYLQFVTQVELSSTLITCFFAFCTGELWMLASIKKTKIKSTDIDDDGVPDDEDDNIDPQYIKEMEDLVKKLKEKNNKEQ